MNYDDLHWGTPAKYRTKLSCLSGRASVVGECRACSYVTIKADKPDVYRHQFKVVDGRGPYLLRGDTKGDYELGSCPDDTIAVGRALDFEMKDGTRWICGVDLFLVTDRGGDHLWLVGPNIPYELEKRSTGPIVTVRGIEA
jgi:hypothetical protein